MSHGPATRPYPRTSLPSLAAALALAFAPAVARASTMVVTTLDDVENASDGVCSLREAIASLGGAPADATCPIDTAAADTVVLEGGTHCVAAALDIGSDVTVLGAADGLTIIDGGNGLDTTCAVPSGDPVFTIASVLTVTLDSLTVQGGLSSVGGGGILASYSTDLSLSGVVLRDNSVWAASGSVGGGGLHVGIYSTLTISGSDITDNEVYCPLDESSPCARGGGINTDSGATVSISDSLIANNLITSAYDTALGGGVHLGSSLVAPSTLAVVGSTISGNVVLGDGTSGAHGGGIATDACTSMTLRDSVVENNSIEAGTARGFGGGLSLTNCSEVQIDASTVRGNRNLVTASGVGAYGGGVYLSLVSAATITGSTISANEAVHVGTTATGMAYGGGLYVHDGMAALLNTTVSGNRADADGDAYGGGVFAKGAADVYLVHSTVAANVADAGIGAYGGGLSHFRTVSTPRDEMIVLLNSVIAGNDAIGVRRASGDDCYDQMFTLGNNLISQDLFCVLDASLASGAIADQVGVDPLLGVLQDNCGAVETHALGAASTARGGGTCLDESDAPVATDACGVPRDDTCDIGAWEYSDIVSDPDDIDGDGYASADGDCDDTNAAIHPGAIEACNDLDDDCDGFVDDGATTTWYLDFDGDGYGSAGSSVETCSAPLGYVTNNADCDDGDASVGSGSTWYADFDGDGYGSAGSSVETCSAPLGYVTDNSDCDDGDASVSSGSTWYADFDGDGYGSAAASVETCSAPLGYVADGSDCDDGDASVNANSTWYLDADGDGYGSTASTWECAQPTGYVGDSSDCDDGNASVNADRTWYLDADGDGYGSAAASVETCTAPLGYVADGSDCDDGDASVNADSTWYLDADGDGYGSTASTWECAQPTGYVAVLGDCDDSRGDVSPGAAETCSGRDDDCDGATDEADALGCTTYYYDADNDGYGTTVSSCMCASSGSYRATAGGDCYDSNSNAKPGATTWYSTNRGDGSYDYDCDGSQEERYTNTGRCAVSGTTCAVTQGFLYSSATPACGSTTGKTVASCKYKSGACTERTTTTTQTCQ